MAKSLSLNDFFVELGTKSRVALDSQVGLDTTDSQTKFSPSTKNKEAIGSRSKDVIVNEQDQNVVYSWIKEQKH
jgi:hypothetical protein